MILVSLCVHVVLCREMVTRCISVTVRNASESNQVDLILISDSRLRISRLEAMIRRFPIENGLRQAKEELTEVVDRLVD